MSHLPKFWHVYLVRCRDDSLYCGIAVSVSRRIVQHNSGAGAKYIVPSRRPVKCVWKRKARDHGDALRLEYWLKHGGAAVKRDLAEGRITLRRGRDGMWQTVRRGSLKRP